MDEMDAEVPELDSEEVYDEFVIEDLAMMRHRRIGEGDTQVWEGCEE